MERALRAFGVALHGTLALELARLIADDAAFERLWKRPRRTGLAVALRTLGAASAAAAVAFRADPRLPEVHPAG